MDEAGRYSQTRTSCFLCLMSLLFTLTHGKDCQTLDGTWTNQLGSEMKLHHTADGELYGEYRTSVERETGSSGYGHSDIVGAAPYNKPGVTFGFAVMFKDGQSITAWTGQCLMCDGEEELVTSWLLRQRVDTCVEKWKSTRIGQDIFSRKNVQDDAGPSYDHTKRSLNKIHRNSRDERSTISAPCGLEGVWYNELGSEVILHHEPNNFITGEYRTAVEVSKGSAGDSHSKVYGLGNTHNLETTFALFVVWREGASVTGWVGQCHLCGNNQTETLGVNWLLRKQVASCDDNWKSTNYGQNGLTRQEQKWGPRKRFGIHTPQQEGEDDVLVQASQTCAASSVVIQHSVVMAAIMTIYMALFL